MTRTLLGPKPVVRLCAVGCVVTACVLSGYESAPAAGHGKATSASVIVVTAGKPSELMFRLSKTSTPPWTAKTSSEKVTFDVSNKGAISHTFKVCAIPAKSATQNVCAGKDTKLLAPGRSTTLTILFTQRGTYEYLSTVPGQAANGMKGLLGVGVKLKTTPTSPSPVTTTTTTTTTPTTPPSSLTGNAVSGKVVFASAGCGSCHTLANAGASGTTGPSLDALRPTQPVIIAYVTNGGNSMPAYAGTLTPTQINDLAAYIYLATHTIN